MTRAQVAEGPELMAGFKSSVAEFFGTQGRFPSTIGTGGSVEGTTTGKYGTITIGSGGGTSGPFVLHYTLTTGRANGQILAMSTTDGSLWECGTQNPSSAAASATTVTAKWLPSGCKP
ncbi:MAG: pilin [Methylophilaceae bacterium]|nr:pilin [Methylophilaceae bacterium]